MDFMEIIKQLNQAILTCELKKVALLQDIKIAHPEKLDTVVKVLTQCGLIGNWHVNRIK